MHVVITENDVSQWDDKTGELYHFPKRYLKYLGKGTKVIYYKGALKDKKFENKRLSSAPHYFGCGMVGKLMRDEKSPKGDFYAEIDGFHLFGKPVLAKLQDQFIEKIPESRKNNYWRDGVRAVSAEVYSRIMDLSGAATDLYSDSLQGTEESLTSRVEGAKKGTYTTKYERIARLRDDAIRIHGLSCQGCGFNFKNAYGDWGAGFIHVHHLKPVATAGIRQVNPTTDLAVLCANCHAMVHRKRDTVLSIKDLAGLLEKA